MDDIKIKLSIEFSITESDLEDSLAEYDELSVDSLIAQILDKSIAVDDVDCKVVTGPNNLEEVDELRASSNAGQALAEVEDEMRGFAGSGFKVSL